ncbi:hypothetical protein OAB57_02450, partial [Bacteriovoracaceae bacterium]|nr:hypothetical protein [Bacteriovoracaceae bacterium]
IGDFDPHFIISIHTPLGILDFDGPKLKFPPKHKKLPWLRLGNFPGSLGRYMWRDAKVPVLTIELKGKHSLKDLDAIDQLQDISGLVAIMSNHRTNTRRKRKSHDKRKISYDASQGTL